MEPSLLLTKLYIPPARPTRVARPRLLERLNEVFRYRLTLISAPPGFGKTTLVSDWLHAGNHRQEAENGKKLSGPIQAGWVSLDEGDNDPIRFLTYLIVALQAVYEHSGQAALTMLHSPQPPPLKAILTTLINELAAAPAEAVLVLDDYHLITARPVHDAVTFLLDHLPPHLHLVIVSRVDPPLPLARLRGRGELVELRSADLRFSPEEVVDFFTRAGLALSMAETATLAARTEGWVAGLQLAALSLQGQDTARVKQFMRTFAGDDRYVLDYLGDEVLRHQPEIVRVFLCQTSILDRLSGPLCDAVLGDLAVEPKELGILGHHGPPAGSQAILEYLERSNLFLVPLDSQRRWYRYHHLFADFLREQLERAQPEAFIAELHGRASAWYEQQGVMAQAIGHALSAKNFERAGDLIEQTGQDLLMRGELATFLSWVAALPEDLVRRRPQLCVWQAWALLFNGQVTEAETQLQTASQAAAGPAILSQVAAVRAFRIVIQGDIAGAAVLARQAGQDLPPEALFLRDVTAVTSGIVDMFGGNVTAISQTFAEIARNSRTRGNSLMAVLAMAQLAEMCTLKAELRQAFEIYQQALEMATTPEGQPLPGAGMVHAGLAVLVYQWNDLEAAGQHISESLRLSQQLGEAGTFDGYVMLARLKQAQGDTTGAFEVLQLGQQFIRRFSALGNLVLDVLRVRLWLDEGNLSAAAGWAQVYRQNPAVYGLTPVEIGSDGGSIPAMYYPYEMGQLCLARVLLAQARHSVHGSALPEARRLLAVLGQQAEQLGWVSTTIEVLMLQALAAYAGQEKDRAVSLLEQALNLAQPGNYVRLFIDEGQPMAELLAILSERSSGERRVYIERLRAAPGLEAPLPDSGRAFPAEPVPKTDLYVPYLVEPLSERELEVLRLIAAGRSNRDIARSLVLAPGTVKKHTSNLYGKLGVHSRTQALARARTLGLLED